MCSPLFFDFDLIKTRQQAPIHRIPRLHPFLHDCSPVFANLSGNEMNPVERKKQIRFHPNSIQKEWLFHRFFLLHLYAYQFDYTIEIAYPHPFLADCRSATIPFTAKSIKYGSEHPIEL